MSNDKEEMIERYGGRGGDVEGVFGAFLWNLEYVVGHVDQTLVHPIHFIAYDEHKTSGRVIGIEGMQWYAAV